MTSTVYMFEAHSIQSYVLSGGTLRDMTCARELIESLISVQSDSVDLKKLTELDLALLQCGLTFD